MSGYDSRNGATCMVRFSLPSAGTSTQLRLRVLFRRHHKGRNPRKHLLPRELARGNDRPPREALGHILLQAERCHGWFVGAFRALFIPLTLTLICMRRSGWKNSIPTLKYGQRFRESRKLLKKGLGPAAVQSYRPYLNRENPFFLENLLNTPEDFTEHFTRWACIGGQWPRHGANHVLLSTAARISLKIAYGYESVTEDLRLIQNGVNAMKIFCATAAPGVWLVDTFSFCESTFWMSAPANF